MSASAAESRGSKRCTVEDETSQGTEESRASKRLKPAKKTSSNEEQNISHYFARKGTETRKMEMSRGSDDQTGELSSKAAPAKKTSQRKDRPISPPAPSRRRKATQTSKDECVDDEQSQEPNKKDFGGKNNNTSSNLEITEHIGDIFDAPINALLIHACNCKGWWSKGIAAAFKEKYPAAFKIYQTHCKKTPDKQLMGKALLIPPQPGDRHQHYVGCVFTSAATGLKVDPPHKILKATGPAMTDLLSQARSYVSSGKGIFSDIRICKINSGLFKVEWEDTLEVLKTEVQPHGFRSMEVVSMSGG